MASILIAGDTCPVGRNEPLFRKGDAAGLLGDLATEFEAADLVIGNLECPLIEREAPIAKCGPNSGAPVDCVKGLAAMDTLCSTITRTSPARETASPGFAVGTVFKG